MTDQIKYGLQISTGRDQTKVPEGTGVLITAVSEDAEGVVIVNTKAEGFEASQEGAEAIRDLFRDMADAIDEELGNVPPGGQTRRGSADRCEVCGEPLEEGEFVHTRCLGRVKRFPHPREEALKEARKPQFNPKPRQIDTRSEDGTITVRPSGRQAGKATEAKERASRRAPVPGAENIHRDNVRRPSGLAAQRERKARKHD